jgi:PadR family transcriptional regulator, regulatory protein PadR
MTSEERRRSGDSTTSMADDFSQRQDASSEEQTEETADAKSGRPSDRKPTPPVADLPVSWSFRGFLIAYILLLLSLQRAHGYFIEQYLKGLGLLNVELSNLYRTLRQLESAGLVTSSWEHGADGPARRVYSITDSGRWWLDTNAGVLQGYRTLIDRFFGSYGGRETPPREND